MRGIVILGLSLMLGWVGCGGGTHGPKSAAMPEGGNWSGVYFSPQYGEMHLVQNGSAVMGRFKKDERTGDIQGEADGNLLEFEWTEYKAMVSNRPQETKGHGYFQYLATESGDHRLKGPGGIGDGRRERWRMERYQLAQQGARSDSLRDKTRGGGRATTSWTPDDSSDRLRDRHPTRATTAVGRRQLLR